ncbi:mitochondrial protein-like protein [Microthyrium microscopicum]|uniref:MICOS complex subunit n=1 Tax=Microthyrium microscopicum TaxID=703497 RepID=A0A6A6U369_9PEZI|nr:mitochondrial protein-like protein [Microthyrium microscopicum]
MASRSILRHRAVAPTIAGMAVAIVLTPRSALHADTAPRWDEDVLKTSRKPIYDDPAESDNHESIPTRPKPSQLPTPTDRLTVQIARSRLFIHQHAASLEDRANALASRAFHLEHNFTSTLAGLAPSRQSGEVIMPNAIYVLVSGMGASVLVRNRNILLRATAPLAVGLAAANYLLPATMKNVGGLVWRWEQKWPVLAEGHKKTQERVENFVRTGIEHSKMGKVMLEDKIGGARENLEGWVSRGR